MDIFQNSCPLNHLVQNTMYKKSSANITCFASSDNLIFAFIIFQRIIHLDTTHFTETKGQNLVLCYLHNTVPYHHPIF